MSKKRNLYKKKSNIIEKVHAIAQRAQDPNHRRDAQEMINFYLRNSFLPQRLQSRAQELMRLNGYLSRNVEQSSSTKRHYLYAISNGDAIKVGFSVNPKARLKDMQTSNHNELRIVWQCYCAESPKEASRQERRLHKFIDKYRLRGEWFDIKCLNKVKGWRVKNWCTDKEEEELRLYEEITSNIPECF